MNQDQRPRQGMNPMRTTKTLAHGAAAALAAQIDEVLRQIREGVPESEIADNAQKQFGQAPNNLQ